MASFQNEQRTDIRSIIICCALFFILGFITWANGTLIPFLKLSLDLATDLQAFLVAFASYIAYFFLALPSSWILKKIGFKNGLVVSLFYPGTRCIDIYTGCRLQELPVISFCHIYPGFRNGTPANSYKPLHQHYRAC